MKLCAHVINADTGLAPNPFQGYCTTALCTPSHMNAKMERGDWLIGHSSKDDGNRLVYAMRISKVLGMDEYFRDVRFQCKKPNLGGAPEEQCGDNLYYRDDGKWMRLPSHFHNDCGAFQKDLGNKFDGRPVFVANHFYYFGIAKVAIPDRLWGVICKRRGIQPTESHLADDFVTWLEANYSPGILGQPSHMADHSHETSPMITEWLSDCTQPTTNQQRQNCMPKQLSITAAQQRIGGCR